MSMKFQHIKELIELVDNKGLTRVDIEKEGFKISIRKDHESIMTSSIEPHPQVERVIQQPVKVVKEVQKEVQEIQEQVAENKQVEAEEAIIIQSPMVGTYYSAPSPDEADYVKVGDKVALGDTLCIIEAMKLMNDIEAEVSGEIVEILVKNEDIVEYGQPLFKVKA